MTAQPVRYVAICPEHGDHTGGKDAFPAGTAFLSKPQTLRLGGTEIRIVDNGRAHTGTDLEVYLPAEKIFSVSEVFSNHIFPNMRTAEVTRVHKTGATQEAGLKLANWGPYASWPVLDRNAPMAFQRVYDELEGKLK